MQGFPPLHLHFLLKWNCAHHKVAVSQHQLLPKADKKVANQSIFATNNSRRSIDFFFYAMHLPNVFSKKATRNWSLNPLLSEKIRRI